MKRFLYWSPRILMLLFIAFISLLAFDSFSDPNWPVALFMHLILGLLTYLAWKNERIGGIFLIIISIIMAFFFNSFVLPIPVFVAGILFLTDFYKN